MSDYTEYFLSADADVVQFECIELAHANFSQTYRVVRNNVAGLTVTHEDASTKVYQYYPLKITAEGSRDDLDQGLRIDVGDLGEIIPAELDAVHTAGGFGTKPTLTYRSYRSDDLTAPLVGPLALEVSSVAFREEGASITAEAPRLNLGRTGIIYTLDEFPMLRGLL